MNHIDNYLIKDKLSYLSLYINVNHMLFPVRGFLWHTRNQAYNSNFISLFLDIEDESEGTISLSFFFSFPDKLISRLMGNNKMSLHNVVTDEGYIY